MRRGLFDQHGRACPVGVATVNEPTPNLLSVLPDLGVDRHSSLRSTTPHPIGVGRTRPVRSDGSAASPVGVRLVGVRGFEPPASTSRTWRANQAALHPVAAAHATGRSPLPITRFRVGRRPHSSRGRSRLGRVRRRRERRRRLRRPRPSRRPRRGVRRARARRRGPRYRCRPQRPCARHDAGGVGRAA